MYIVEDGAGSGVVRRAGGSATVSGRVSTGFLFLSEEWIRRTVSAIERAKASDESLGSQASEFSLSVAYTIENLPEKLREHYGSDKVTIYVELDEGALKRFTVGTEMPGGKNPDFVVRSEYEVVKKNFQGELNPVSTFIRRRIKVEPYRRLYADPSFTARSLSTINALLRVMRDVPTVFPE